MKNQNRSYITYKSMGQYIADKDYSMHTLIRQIIIYFRVHRELWAIADYRRLYDEVLELWANLIDGTEGANCEPGKLGDLEFLADLYIKYSLAPGEMFTREQVDDYLEHRRTVWQNCYSNFAP